jgi:hypothetical protein
MSDRRKGAALVGDWDGAAYEDGPPWMSPVDINAARWRYLNEEGPPLGTTARLLPPFFLGIQKCVARCLIVTVRART